MFLQNLEQVILKLKLDTIADILVYTACTLRDWNIRNDLHRHFYYRYYFVVHMPSRYQNASIYQQYQFLNFLQI